MSQTTNDPLIVKVIQHYFPDWDPPEDRGKEWAKCLCPFHGESNPSATVSFKNNAFKCHACGEKGDALAILMRKEEIGYREALDYAETISPGSHQQVRGKPAGQSGRRVFGDQGTDRRSVGQGPTVPTRVRGRSAPWT